MAIEDDAIEQPTITLVERLLTRILKNEYKIDLHERLDTLRGLGYSWSDIARHFERETGIFIAGQTYMAWSKARSTEQVAS